MIGHILLEEKVLTTAALIQIEKQLAQLAARADVHALILTSAGANFSFGASVEEHLPPKVNQMLSHFGSVVRGLLAFPVPVAAAVRGNCLGGGLELALAGMRIFAAPEARLGQPEIRLGVLAPAACALLPERIGQAAAAELLTTGRVVNAEEALRLRLVDELADDPLQRAEAWAAEHLEPLSTSALRLVHRAVRGAWADRVSTALAGFEALYRQEVIASPDALEGLRAFVEKRAPRWRRG